MDAISDKLLETYLKLTYKVADEAAWQQGTADFLNAKQMSRAEFLKLMEDGVQKFPPDSNDARLNFIRRLPVSRWWEPPFFDILVKPLTDAKVKLPEKSSHWADNLQLTAETEEPVTAGILDFPRKQLPAAVWKYEDDEPLPHLQPKLRAMILSEARYRLAKFGAKLIGANLYGGAATYQYHEGADIDTSLYIDWDDFNGSEELLQDAFKAVEIPWEGYVVHLFVKPSNQKEQIEVSDATYDVLHDEWTLQPLILPKDFDPNIFFAPMIEIAEKKAEKLDKLMGRVTREWAKLKAAVEARKEGPRDEEAVENRIILQKTIVKQEIDRLVAEFVQVWKARKRMHDDLRTQFVSHKNMDRFVRFQPAEVTWKYLDQSGYAEYLKLLSKAHEEGVIDRLMESI